MDHTKLLFSCKCSNDTSLLYEIGKSFVEFINENHLFLFI